MVTSSRVTTRLTTRLADISVEICRRSSIGIVQTNATPNSIGANYFALDLDPIGSPLPLPGCTVYLPLAQIIPGNVFLTSASGTGGSSFNVPSGFPGYLINCQAAVLDPNPLGFLLSNSALICLQ